MHQCFGRAQAIPDISMFIPFLTKSKAQQPHSIAPNNQGLITHEVVSDCVLESTAWMSNQFTVVFFKYLENNNVNIYIYTRYFTHLYTFILSTLAYLIWLVDDIPWLMHFAFCLDNIWKGTLTDMWLFNDPSNSFCLTIILINKSTNGPNTTISLIYNYIFWNWHKRRIKRPFSMGFSMYTGVKISLPRDAVLGVKPQAVWYHPAAPFGSSRPSQVLPP